MAILKCLCPFFLALFGNFRVADEPDNRGTYRLGGPSVPLAGIERINVVGNVFGWGERHFIKPIEINHHVELCAESDEVVQDNQLLRLFITACAEIDNDKLLAERGGVIV